MVVRGLPNNPDMGSNINAFDWARTLLGPITNWPERLRTSVDFILSGGFPAMVLWGPDLLQIYNDGCRDLMGVKHPAGLGQPTRVCWPETWHIAEPIYDRVRAGESLIFEDKCILLCRHGHSEEAWFTLSYAPLWGEEGTVTGVLVTAIETTARHRAERAVRESEARFRAFVTARSDVVYRMNADWSEMCQLDGRGLLSDTREPSETWMDRYIPPNDQASVRGAIIKAIRRGTIFELEHRVLRADGGTGWVLSRAVPVRDGSGKVVEWLGAASDVTERRKTETALRESETRVRDLVKGIALAIWEADSTGLVTVDSPSWRALTGQSRAEWLGNGWLDALHPDDRARTQGLWEAARVSRHPVDTEYRLWTTAGAWRWVGVRAAPVFDAEGMIQKWVGMTVDVHDRRQAEEQLREAEERVAFLLALSDALRPLTDPAVIEMTACRLLGERLGVERAYYVELDEPAGIARIGQDYRQGDLLSFAGDHPILFIAWCLPPLRAGQPFIVADVRVDDRIPKADRITLAAVGLTAFASTPLVKEGRLVGTFSVNVGTSRDWTTAEIELIRETGERVWEAVERARTQACLRESEARFRGFADASADVLWLAETRNERLNYLSPAFEQVFGVPREGVMAGAFNVAPLIHPEDREIFLSMRPRALAGEEVIAHYRVTRPDGSVVHTRDTAFVIRDRHGEVIQLGGVVQDISDIEAARASLEAEKERFRSLVEGIPALVWRASAEGEWTWASPQWLQFTGQTQAESREFGWLAAIHAADRPAVAAAWQVARARELLDLEFRVRRASDGCYLWHRTRSTPVKNGQGSIIEWLGTTTDIQDLKQMQEMLLHAALHDDLTGLRNRAFLTDRLNVVLDREKNGMEGRCALLFLDLDRFKMVNDSLGHPAGDQLLVEVSRRLEACVRSPDTVARFGGDEFAMLIEDAGDLEAVTSIAEQVIDALRQPVRLGEQDIYTSCSIGVVHGTGGYSTAADLLRDADIAMYRAKRDESGGYAIFSQTMRDSAVEALGIRTDLRKALTRREFSLHYQPIYNIMAGTVVGVEALIRWQHPVQGLVSPATFIPAAEENGLMREIGRWVLNEACTQLRAWSDLYPGIDLYLNVNTSGIELYDSSYASDVQDALSTASLAPSKLQLEVTESVFLNQPAVVGEILASLRALGIRVALDDFGTGYSSLGYLDSYRIDTIKIDRSFISGMLTRPNAAAIVRTIIGLGQAMELSIVAEGVESIEQLNALREAGCGLAQGYFTGRPMPAESFTALLALRGG